MNKYYLLAFPIFGVGFAFGLFFANSGRLQSEDPVGLNDISNKDDISLVEQKKGVSSLFSGDHSEFALIDIAPSGNLFELRLERLGQKIEDGRASIEDISLLMEALSEKSPNSIMKFVASLDPKVVKSLRLRSLALCKLAGHQPRVAADYLGQSQMDDFEGRELYDIGLKLLKNGNMAAEIVAVLNPDMHEALRKAEAESIVRREGIKGLVSWIGSLDSSTVKKTDESGNLIAEESGPTIFALDQLSHFLKETSTVDKEQLFSQLSNAPFTNNTLELTSTFKLLAEIDPIRALELAGNLQGSNAFAAERGAFIEVAKSNSEIALKYLSETYDQNKQNMMLTLLAGYTPDEQIRSECEDLLRERNLELPSRR